MRHFLMKPNENASISLCVRPSKNLDKRLWCPPYQCQSLHFPKQTCQNCVHYISHYTFLNKHVKIASHFPSVHYINHYTFLIQISQNCVHMQVSTISITTHFLHNLSVESLSQ